jgi:excisionase family DNA binding protein
MEQEPMLTVQEAAERLKLKPETIRVWLRTGDVKGHLINRRAGWRIPLSEVERILGRRS